MKLDPRSRRLLEEARLGMLALNAGRLPLVNPAAYSFSRGSVWMTTSRHAVKLFLSRRDPRGAFLVRSGGHSVLLQGLLESYDLRSPAGSFRAALDGPGFALSVAGYALKNASYIGGYLVDVAGIPREWWPQNRVVMRLRPVRARIVRGELEEDASDAVLEGLPAGLEAELASVGTGYLAWGHRGYPEILPAMWAPAEGGVSAWLPAGLPHPPDGAASALVIERHHEFRATRMAGCCYRGKAEPDPDAADAIGERYAVELPDGGHVVRVVARKVTWWRGFEVRTDPQAPRRRPAAAAGSAGKDGRRRSARSPAKPSGAPGAAAPGR